MKIGYTILVYIERDIYEPGKQNLSIWASSTDPVDWSTFTSPTSTYCQWVDRKHFHADTIRLCLYGSNSAIAVMYIFISYIKSQLRAKGSCTWIDSCIYVKAVYTILSEFNYFSVLQPTVPPHRVTPVPK